MRLPAGVKTLPAIPSPSPLTVGIGSSSPGRNQRKAFSTVRFSSLSRCNTNHSRPLIVDRLTKTRKYPNLHPILAADTTLARVDVRYDPSSEPAIPNATYFAYQHAHATTAQASHVRLISDDFPWLIDIKTSGYPVTCGDVWNALYAALREPLADSEWGVISHDSSKAKKVQKATKHRQSEIDRDMSLKRVDWVADSYIFRGLEKDDGFAKRRLAYVNSECEETWVVKMAAP